jgi:hypothetical protein
MSGLAPTDIVNQAVQIYGDDQPAVTGVYPTFDNSSAGQAAQKLYGPCVQTVARQFGWDFGRNVVALALSGNVAPLGFSFEYVYPALAAEVLQLRAPMLPDPNNPLPVNSTIGSVPVSGVPTKVIWTNLANAEAVFTNAQANNPATWDPLFREAVVRLLGSEMAAAVAGKQATARDLLEQSGGFGQVGVTRPD